MAETLRRIYSVRDELADPDTKPRMVKAASQAQAIHHVVQDRFTATVTSAEDAYQLGTAGVIVEDASKPKG